MSAAHTAGPWVVGREDFHYGSPAFPYISIERKVTYVAGVAPTTYRLGSVDYPSSSNGTVGAEERRANARLIASAPDGLDVAKAAYLAILCENGKFRLQSQRLLCQLRDYIAKATGADSEAVQDEFEELSVKNRLEVRP